MLDIYPIAFTGLDCKTNSILTIVNWKLGECMLAFWDTWRFTYKKGNDLGNSIVISMNEIELSVAKYYGAKVISLGENIDEVLGEIHMLLQEGKPILVCSDTFYCEWYENYQKHHSKHVFIITGYDSGEWYVVDTIPIRVNQIISDDNFTKSFLWAGFVAFEEEQHNFRPSNNRELLVNAIERKKNLKETKQLEMFLEHIKKTDLQNELEIDAYIWSIPLLDNVRKVYGSRIQFFELFKTLKYPYKVCELEKVMQPIMAEWGIIVNLLYKMKLGKNYDKTEFLKRLNRVIEFEKKAEFTIEVMLENNMEILDKERDYVLLKMDFNANSHFFEKKNLIRLTKWEHGIHEENDITKLFLSQNYLKEDNCFLCNGQEFTVQLRKVKRIHFLGYATWGDQVETIKIKYEDEVCFNDFAFSDWCNPPSFGEEVIWKGDFESLNDSTKYCGKIYDMYISVRSDKLLKSFIVPNCKNIVLFTIIIETEK